MATQRFVNGLKWTFTSWGGRTFSRFLVEWLTKVVGWTLIDKAVGTKWDNVQASGSTCTSIPGNMRVDITSGGYAFSAADVGKFLTLTGFAAPYEVRDGIYPIKRYIGSVGSVYTIELDTEHGVHEEGIPVGHSGLNWRLWASDGTYTPEVNDIAVVAAKGFTGASKTIGTGVGDSLTYSGGVVTLVDAGAAFVASDVGKSITISDAFNPANDGTFIIGSVVDSNTIQYANILGVTETHAFNWSISYVWHLWIKCGGQSLGGYPQGMPSMIVSPFASWNAGTHSWNDGRRTSEFSSRYVTGYDANMNSSHLIFGEADADHFTLFCRGWQSTRCFFWLHFGELNTFHPENDPRPVVHWHGADNTYNEFDNEWMYPAILLYYDRWANTTAYGIRGLGFDDLTTVGMVATCPATLVGADYNAFNTSRKVVSRYSFMAYRCPIIAECQSSGYMEMRGVFRHVFACNNVLPLARPQGEFKEWFPVRGLIFPWNGSEVLEPNVGFQAYC